MQVLRIQQVAGNDETERAIVETRRRYDFSATYHETASLAPQYGFLRAWHVSGTNSRA
jgi:hypothetical protein